MTTSLFSQTPPARDMGYCVVEALRKKLVFADGANVITVGVVPAGALIISGGAFVTTAFNGTTPTLNVGHADLPTPDPDAFATAIVLSALGYIAFDEIAAAANTRVNSERTVTATMTLSAATAGEAEVIVLFVNNHESGR
jgi:hypothetical protein